MKVASHVATWQFLVGNVIDLPRFLLRFVRILVPNTTNSHYTVLEGIRITANTAACITLVTASFLGTVVAKNVAVTAVTLSVSASSVSQPHFVAT